MKIKASHVTENDLYKIAHQYLITKYSFVAYQVPIFNRMVDCVAINSEEAIIGIEFKLYDWRRGISQVCRNFNSFDYGYLILLKRANNITIINEASKYGIGIIFYDQDENKFDEILCGRRNEHKWNPNVCKIKEYISSKKNYEL